MFTLLQNKGNTGKKRQLGRPRGGGGAADPADLQQATGA